MLIGPVSIGTIDQWKVGPGSVVSWHPSEASKAKAAEAPVSPSPAGYMQANHIRGYRNYRDQGLDYSRLMIAGYDVPGQCDLRTMTYVVNAHVRRHDTYRSWFELQGDEVIRHKLDSSVQIKMVPTKHGEMTKDEFKDLLLATAPPTQWDCFSFGVVQCKDHFTFYMSSDHVHMDAQFMGVALMEFSLMYQALIGGNPPLKLPATSTFENFCIRQREYCESLTVESPEVRAWTDFAEKNVETAGASFPTFPLPLGIGEGGAPCAGELQTFDLMDGEQTHNFELACAEAGARFIGGVFGALAVTENELCGTETYVGLTPTDTRRPEELMTLGWFTGLVPLTVPVAGVTFADAARAAQKSFDAGREAAGVPFDRILELAPHLPKPRAGFPQVNYFDIGLPPLSAFLTSDLSSANIGMYFDGRLSNPLCFWVVRLQQKTMVTVLYPGNPIARESIETYAKALRAVFVRVADGRKSPLGDLAKA
jgi:hypothetical protein